MGGFVVIEAQRLSEAMLVIAKDPVGHPGEHVRWGIEVRPAEEFEHP